MLHAPATRFEQKPPRLAADLTAELHEFDRAGEWHADKNLRLVAIALPPQPLIAHSTRLETGQAQIAEVPALRLAFECLGMQKIELHIEENGGDDFPPGGVCLV